MGLAEDLDRREHGDDQERGDEDQGAHVPAGKVRIAAGQPDRHDERKADEDERGDSEDDVVPAH